MATAPNTDPRFAHHQPMEVRHRDELEWETIRWPGETGKMLFHPGRNGPPSPTRGFCASSRALITPQYPGPTTGGRPVYS